MEWRFETGTEVFSSPAIAEDGTVYFGAEDGYFYAVNPDRSLKWRFKPEGTQVASSPLVASEGTVFFSAWTSNRYLVYALDSGGNLIWKIDGLRCWQSFLISIDGSTLYVSGWDLVAVDIPTGTKKWKLDVSASFAPAMSHDGSTIYSGSYDGRLYAIDTSGIIRWKSDSLGYEPSSPAVDEQGNIYVSVESWCYSFGREGRLRWSYPITGGKGPSSPSIALDGTIYAVGEDKLYALTSEGAEKWSFGFGQVPGGRGFKWSHNSPVSDVDGTVYVGTATQRASGDTINFIVINNDGSLKYSLSLPSPPVTGIPEYMRIPEITSTPAISADGKIYVGSDRPAGFQLFKIQ